MMPSRSLKDDETIDEPPSPPPASLPTTTSPHLADFQERKRVNKNDATMGALDVAKYGARARRARSGNHSQKHEAVIEPPTPPKIMRVSTRLLPPENDQSNRPGRRSTVSPSSIMASLEEIGAMTGSLSKSPTESSVKQMTLGSARKDASMNQRGKRSGRAVRAHDDKNSYADVITDQQAVLFDPSVEVIPPRDPSSFKSAESLVYSISTDGSPWSEAALTVGSRSLLSQAGRSASTFGASSTHAQTMSSMTCSTSSFIERKRILNEMDGPGRVEIEDTEDEEPADDVAHFRRQAQGFHPSNSLRHIRQPSSENPITVVATPVLDCGGEESGRWRRRCYRNWWIMALVLAIVAIAVLATALVTRGVNAGAPKDISITPQGAPDASDFDEEQASVQFTFLMNLSFSTDDIVDKATWLSATSAYLTGVLSLELDNFVTLSLKIQKLDLRRNTREIQRRTQQVTSATFFGTITFDKDPSDSPPTPERIRNIVKSAFTDENIGPYIDSLERDGANISAVSITNEDGTLTIPTEADATVKTPVEVVNPSEGLNQVEPAESPSSDFSGFFLKIPTPQPTESLNELPTSDFGGFFLNLPTVQPAEPEIPLFDPVPISVRGFDIVFPTIEPTKQPSEAPTATAGPSPLPSSSPTSQPTEYHSRTPTCATSSELETNSASSKTPSTLPTGKPTSTPSTATPTNQPTLSPIEDVAEVPSTEPTNFPTQHPTTSPTHFPSKIPSKSPTKVPSQSPTIGQTNNPSGSEEIAMAMLSSSPSNQPTQLPMKDVSEAPSTNPTDLLTQQPSALLTQVPSDMQSVSPTKISSQSPTAKQTQNPSKSEEKETSAPSSIKISQPIHAPMKDPSLTPSQTPFYNPSKEPIEQPSESPTSVPSYSASYHPTNVSNVLKAQSMTPTPSLSPSNQPTQAPTKQLTKVPSSIPTKHPIYPPTEQPTESSTSVPTPNPSRLPSQDLTEKPIQLPTSVPSHTPSKDTSNPPTNPSTESPTSRPTAAPSLQPSNDPTMQPTELPTTVPTVTPSIYPTNAPTEPPTEPVTLGPTNTPSKQPSTDPTKQPVESPTFWPTRTPSKQPTNAPTKFPTIDPSNKPTNSLTEHPTNEPTKQPLASPSNQPTRQPTGSPTPGPSIESTQEATEQLTQPKDVVPRSATPRILRTSMNYKWSRSGATFDVIATKRVKITSIAIHLGATTPNIPLEIYTKEGSYKNNEPWTNKQTAIISKGEGVGELSVVPSDSFSPIEIPAGTSMGFYVTTRDFRYVLLNQGYDVFRDDALKIELGQGVNNYFYRNTEDGNAWSGALIYELV